MFTLYSANCLGQPENCLYPNRIDVTDRESLIVAVSHDYVCAEYQGNYRSNDNYIGSNCLSVECDNDHSENPDDWVMPADVFEAFPGVTFAVHYSRSNMREKNGKPARPKFHVLFPIECMTDPAAYSEMKKMVNTIFPYFDTKALDAARFFFGTADPQVEIFPGEMTLSEYLSADDFELLENGDIQIPHEILKDYNENDCFTAIFEDGSVHCTDGLKDQLVEE